MNGLKMGDPVAMWVTLLVMVGLLAVLPQGRRGGKR
jgi:hypothetical protein